MTRAEAQANLATIQAILNRGLSSTNKDGVSATYDLAQLAIERDRLQKFLATNGRSGQFRKVVYNPSFAD